MTLNDILYKDTIHWFESRGIVPDKFRLGDSNIMYADYGEITYMLGYHSSSDLVDALNSYFKRNISRVTRHIDKLKQLQKDRGK